MDAPTRSHLLDRIWIDPARCGGKPCIRGHRIWVSLVLAVYPGIQLEDIQACLAYGSEISRERYVDIALESRS
jgi:uncharacterized protein (DUF433 family)